MAKQFQGDDLPPLGKPQKTLPPTLPASSTAIEPSGGPLIGPVGSPGDSGPGFPSTPQPPVPATGLPVEPDITPSLPNEPVIETGAPTAAMGMGMPQGGGGLQAALARAMPRLGGSSFGRPGRGAMRFVSRSPLSAPPRFGAGTPTSSGIGLGLDGGLGSGMSQEELLALLMEKLGNGGGYV